MFFAVRAIISRFACPPQITRQRINFMHEKIAISLKCPWDLGTVNLHAVVWWKSKRGLECREDACSLELDFFFSFFLSRSSPSLQIYPSATIGSNQFCQPLNSFSDFILVLVFNTVCKKLLRSCVINSSRRLLNINSTGKQPGSVPGSYLRLTNNTLTLVV